MRLTTCETLGKFLPLSELWAHEVAVILKSILAKSLVNCKNILSPCGMFTYPLNK